MRGKAAIEKEPYYKEIEKIDSRRVWKLRVKAYSGSIGGILSLTGAALILANKEYFGKVGASVGALGIVMVGISLAI